MPMDIEDEVKNSAPQEPECAFSAVSEEQEITSEKLKATTKIHGWLGFFLFQVVAGGLWSAAYPLLTIDKDFHDIYGESYIFAMTDVAEGILLFALAVYTMYSFCNRKPNAVFLGLSYTAICIFLNLFFLICGNLEPTGIGSASHLLRSLVWGSIWICYLLRSNQVNETIPADFRKTSRRDYILVISVIAVPILLMIAGLFDAARIQNAESERIMQKYEETHRNFYDDVKDKLASNQRSDGRIIFDVPKGFECRDTIVQDVQIFGLEKENVASITICSDFDSDNSDENINECWAQWEDAEAAKYKSTVVTNTKDYIATGTKCVKVKKYVINGSDVFWRFVLLFDSDTGKVCLISSYDNGDDAYLKGLIDSVRFHQ